MNWANRLTLSRLVLTALFVLALSSSWPYGRTSALILFLIAGLTDYFDGEIARRYAGVTNFGRLIDPLIDKAMMASAFICLVPLKAIPAWAAAVVVVRDFLITGVRLIASSKGKILPAERLGKHKTSWQIVTVLFFLVLLSLRELQKTSGDTSWWKNAWYYGGDALIGIAVGLTLYSGVKFFWHHRGLIAPEV